MFFFNEHYSLYAHNNAKSHRHITSTQRRTVNLPSPHGAIIRAKVMVEATQSQLFHSFLSEEVTTPSLMVTVWLGLLVTVDVPRWKRTIFELSYYKAKANNCFGSDFISRKASVFIRITFLPLLCMYGFSFRRLTDIDMMLISKMISQREQTFNKLFQHIFSVSLYSVLPTFSNI